VENQRKVSNLESLFNYLFEKMKIKSFLLVAVITTLSGKGLTQNKYTDSLMLQLTVAKDDSTRVLIMADLCYYHRYTNIDTSVFYGQKALALARNIKFLRGEADALNKIGLTFREKGDLPKSLDLQIQALKIAEENNYILETANILRRIALIYIQLKDYPKALNLLNEALRKHNLIQNKRGVAIDNDVLGLVYEETNVLDSALYFVQKALSNLEYMSDNAAEVYRILGNIQTKKGNYLSALSFYNNGIRDALKINDYRTVSFIYANVANMLDQADQPDSSISAAKNGLKYGRMASYQNGILLSSSLLSRLYDSINPKEALRYYKIAAAAKDSLYGAGNIRTIQTIIARENERQKEVEATKTAYQNRLKQYSLLAGFGAILVIAFILYRNNRHKQKANKFLQTTLNNLKSTQAQLIQSEKMASLGELTAGIAHEIQNPLNFVNNFSDVNKDLLTELNGEIDKGNYGDAKAIAKDVMDNEEKINHHGKRADAIVKGMLQHSRTSSGQKEVTDINVLADEYLRLAYHGLRAKDKSFNAKFETHFDHNIGKINIIQQEIGRVILNLINNAFYAVSEKKKHISAGSALNARLPNGQGYEPTVAVTTMKHDDKIEIRVKDNGNGIPKNIIDKIFQPFFTTKPTGQGTGLGLSLAYDIIKAHGGEINVKTKEGEGSEFIVQLPTK
jgi:signal transduction histidine kinase